MATALIHMDPKQKHRLTQRAKLRGKSFSQEVRDAEEDVADAKDGADKDIAELRLYQLKEVQAALAR